jgi:hypothetical protein
VGTVHRVDAEKKWISLIVERVHVRPGQKARGHVPELVKVYDKEVESSVERGFAAGDTLNLKVYTGVVWDNPRKSPIDRRLNGHIQLDEQLAGVRVVYASSELLAASKATLRKLELFYNPDSMAAYRKSSALKQLAADLADFDLFDTAQAEIVKRGKPLLPLLIAAASRARGQHDPLMKHFLGLKADERREFFAQASTYFTKNPRPDEVGVVLDRVTYQASAADLPELATFAATVAGILKPDDKKGAEFAERVAELEKRPAEAK